MNYEMLAIAELGGLVVGFVLIAAGVFCAVDWFLREREGDWLPEPPRPKKRKKGKRK